MLPAPTPRQSRHQGGGREWEPRVGILHTTVTLFLLVPTVSRLPSVGFRGSSPPTVQLGARRQSRRRRAPLLGPGRRCLLQSVGLCAQGAAPVLSRVPGASPVRQVTAEPPRRSSLCGHPGAALSVQGLSPEPSSSPQSAGLCVWGAVPMPPRTPGALPVRRGPRVPHSGASARAPRGGPANVGPFSRAGTGLSLPSTGLHTRSTTQRPPGPAARPQPGAAASVRATASEPNQPRRPRPSRPFIFLSPRSRSGRGGRSEPAFRHRSPPPAPRDPGITGRVEAASLARQNRVSYGRMTEGSRALSECDRHLDARSHAPLDSSLLNTCHSAGYQNIVMGPTKNN
ncbi:hypothetical protein NDU88_000456 [Pleurodeles waltl]|uniref:Uncharacterized protein n=1 Tax=Pleurodeles waltl TaxID=8319 RepID=A0AAV7KM65_PLEWA|nr:hypothetical protein NDU88_000456 [Pleurodeles waltl]